VTALDQFDLFVNTTGAIPTWGFKRWVKTDQGFSYPVTVPVEKQWAEEDPATAYEMLASRGLIPMEWVGSEDRIFVCETCSGTGHQGSGDCSLPGSCLECLVCGWAGALPHPPSLRALLGWASLGPAFILKVEEVFRADNPLHTGPVCWSCSDWLPPPDPPTGEKGIVCHTTRFDRNLREAGLYVRDLEDSELGRVVCVPPL
jgi:hypothetical protein